MKNIWNWIKNNALIVLSVLIILMSFKTCSTSSNVKTLTKEVRQMELKIDSIQKTQITNEDLRIEGLKSEKRMIQSTDRKRFDLEREKQIDEELNTLMSKK